MTTSTASTPERLDGPGAQPARTAPSVRRPPQLRPVPRSRLVRGWRRWLTGPFGTQYQRLAVLVVLVNLAVAQHLSTTTTTSTDRLDTIADAVAVNLTIAALIRQQHVVNLLFRIATSAPTSWPLSIRRRLGKIYHFGGIHVGAALSATTWYAAYATTLLTDPDARTLPVLLTTVTLLLLLRILLHTIPPIRQRFHDRFEQTHRFGGWTVLALMWAQLSIPPLDTSHHPTTLTSTLTAITTEPRSWLLATVTLSVTLPWLLLRKVPVHIDTPSNHVALLTFDYGVTPFPGSSTALATHPLGDWHSFANIPHPHRDGYRLAVSAAGDWTRQLINRPPTHLWVKSIPTAGVGNIDQLFHKVLWVATGSGIGPCLPHLLARTAPAALLWSVRDPHHTYGQALLTEITDHVDELTIWNTTTHGKPDLAQLVTDAVHRYHPEAVICISNKPTTWTIVQTMELQGIPAYGAIWDS